MKKKPKKVNGRVPDLIARKDGREVILEVETSSTVNTDKKQHQAFKEYADRKKGREFKVKIVKPKKRRKRK